jgi:hypothetical protein
MLGWLANIEFEGIRKDVVAVQLKYYPVLCLEEQWTGVPAVFRNEDLPIIPKTNCTVKWKF